MGIWRLPFDGQLKPYEEGQQFGSTTYPRGRGYFHDGYDFGSAKYSGNFKAVNDGKVIYAGYYGAGIGTAIVLQIAEYQVMYQEFGNTYFVKAGDTVKAGQPLGTLTSNHLHLGITKKDWKTALGSWDINDGTWINPIPLLTSGSSTEEKPKTKKGGNIMLLFKDSNGTVFFLVGNQYVSVANPGDLSSIKTMMTQAGYDTHEHTSAIQVSYIKRIAVQK